MVITLDSFSQHNTQTCGLKEIQQQIHKNTTVDALSKQSNHMTTTTTTAATTTMATTS